MAINKRMLDYPFLGRLYSLSILTLILLFTNGLNAQDATFTQFYSNPVYLNPAFAGTNNCPRVSMNYRNQWPNLSGTYVTYSASYDQYVKGLGGIGFYALRDDAGRGTLTTNRASGVYSYINKIDRTWNFSFGAEGSVYQRALDASKLSFGDQIDPIKGFVYPTNEVVASEAFLNFDFSAGALVYSDNIFAGVAVHHITQPEETFLSGSTLPMKITVHGGATYPLGGKYGRRKDDAAKISPNILYQQQGKFKELNLGMYVQKGPLIGGLWYRSKDSFIALVGIQTGIFKIGYSYDVTVSRLTAESGGSHEVSLGFFFDCSEKTKRYRSPVCPVF